MKTVNDVMTPVRAYTTVSDQATLLDAIIALETAQRAKTDEPERMADRAVLVLRGNRHVVGKITMWDILHGLEPRYGEIDPLAMSASYGIWNRNILNNLAEKARLVKVSDMLDLPEAEERIESGAPLDKAVGQLVRGRLMSLLVMEKNEVIGVLRMSDVFADVSMMVKHAEAEAA
jgi:CBS domain-containing protein